MLSTIGLFAVCLPPVGTVLPLRTSLRVPTGIVVQVFDARSNDAEFRGCDAQTCRVMIHRRARIGGAWQTRPFEARGFGPVIEMPAAILEDSVRLPACAPKPPTPVERAPVKPAPIAKVRKRPRRRRPIVRDAPAPEPVTQRAPPAPVPPPTDADRLPFAPAPAVLLRRMARYDASGPPAPPPGLAIAPQTIAAKLTPVRSGGFVAPGGRVTGEIHPDGRVEFDAEPTVTVDDGGMRGEGLNALDGADIYAREKRLFLERTADARARMYRRDRRMRAMDLGALRSACAAAMTQLSGAARRTQLFMLWDEIDEAPSGELAASARHARAYVERVIRDQLPRQRGGFSLDELARLNACRAESLFDPYADADLPIRARQAVAQCPDRRKSSALKLSEKRPTLPPDRTAPR